MKRKSMIIISAVIIIFLALGLLLYPRAAEEYEPVCGDSYCDPIYESWETCPDDCPIPSCNDDGICDPWETPECNDCIIDTCDNGEIDPGETCKTCPEDVGECQEEIILGLSFRRPYVPIYVDDTFWVTFYGIPDTDCIDAYQISITYDTDKLEYIQHKTSSPWSYWVPGDHDVEAGSITKISAMHDAELCAKGDFFRIQFKSLEIGEADLKITHVKMTDQYTNEITGLPYVDNTIIIIE